MNMFNVFVLCANLCFVCCGIIPKELFRLDIVHYNDFHDRFEETSVLYPVCLTNDTKCVGGFARLYHEVQTLLKEKPDALVLNAGDTFQGTYWYTLYKWNITQTFINMLPNDAHAIGNHEFDDGVAGIAPYLAALHAPVVAANIDTSKEPALEGLYKPHVILERKGRKIGIIGLITPETGISSNSGRVQFYDPVQTAKKEAKILTEEGVDIIILLSHCGLEVDKAIARNVGENIDIIVGGHSHSLLWNGESPSKENVAGPYPVILESQSKPGHKVLVVTASAFTKYLGNLTTYFDKYGELQSFDGSPIFLNRSIPEDPQMKKLLQPYADELHTLVQETIGFANNDLLANDCGAAECGIGDMIADSFLNSTKEYFKNNKMKDTKPHVVFLLRNMIRGSIAKGVITRGGIINTLPFTNSVMTFSLLGKHLIEAFERCLTNYWVAHPFNGPWMPHVAGVRLTLNAINGTATILIKDGDAYRPLDPEKIYQVTSLNFLTRGGNGFKMIEENARNVTFIGKDADILEGYIRKISPIMTSLDGRLKVLNEEKIES